MIEVARDIEGLRQAALGLFRAGLVAMARSKLTEKNASLAEALAGPEIGLAAGYYERVEYLLLLDRREVTRLLAIDARGLEAVRDAREQFRRDHRACQQCGALSLGPSWDWCWNCGQPGSEQEKES